MLSQLYHYLPIKIILTKDSLFDWFNHVLYYNCRLVEVVLQSIHVHAQITLQNSIVVIPIVNKLERLRELAEIKT